MLYLIGLGLGDAKDITVKGLEVIKQCHKVYLEAYTSMLTVGKEVLVGLQAIGLQVVTVCCSYKKVLRRILEMVDLECNQ